MAGLAEGVEGMTLGKLISSAGFTGYLAGHEVRQEYTELKNTVLLQYYFISCLFNASSHPVLDCLFKTNSK